MKMVPSRRARFLIFAPIAALCLSVVYLRINPPLNRANPALGRMPESPADNAPLPTDPRVLGDMLIAARGAAQQAAAAGRDEEAALSQQRVDRILRALRQAQNAPPEIRRGALHW